ncbi:hypothetical protein CEE35_05325 [Candidatus Aerophobetes bacterium Ae_b3b]|nr:MAG: hypothetical protein CEE35_05325 [Candidatus Aerophobetes bacterium Ae_b3b]
MADENRGVDKKNMYGMILLNRFGKIETVFSSGFFLQLIKNVRILLDIPGAGSLYYFLLVII